MNIRLAYCKALRKLLMRMALGNRSGVVYSVALRSVGYRVTKNGRLAVAYQQAKEHANWLTMGDKHPHQKAN